MAAILVPKSRRFRWLLNKHWIFNIIQKCQNILYLSGNFLAPALCFYVLLLCLLTAEQVIVHDLGLAGSINNWMSMNDAVLAVHCEQLIIMYGGIMWKTIGHIRTNALVLCEWKDKKIGNSFESRRQNPSHQNDKGTWENIAVLQHHQQYQKQHVAMLSSVDDRLTYGPFWLLL